MYKTNYSVTIKSISAPEEPTELTGDAAQAAIAQMTSHRDVDVVNVVGGERQGVIIPYHDIDSAIIEETRTESEYTDDNAKNCVIPDSGEKADLTMINGTNVTLPNTTAFFASEPLNGTYGDVTFTTQAPEGNTFPEGYQSVGYMTEALIPSQSVVISGLPVGTLIGMWSDQMVMVMAIGAAPGTYTYTGQQQN